MGSAKRFKQLFLIANPICYYCTRKTSVTIDHVPSRECFKDRIGPEGFVFPACEECNRLDSKIEQAVACYVRMFDMDGLGGSEEQLKKLGQGVKNNTPELMPHLLRTRDKRNAVKDGLLQRGAFSTYHDAPMVGFPAAGYQALERFARKLTCAMYYKHMGKPLPLNYFINTIVMFYSEERSKEPLNKLNEILPEYVLTGRINTDIGEQFHYRYGINTEENLFGFISQFARSLFVVGSYQASLSETHIGWRGRLVRDSFLGFEA